MGKPRKNSLVDQVIDELNEEVQSSLRTTPDLFIADGEDELVSAALDKDQDTSSLAHFKPQKSQFTSPNLEKKSSSKKEGLDRLESAAPMVDVPINITLQQSENLRVAQERIVSLENEIERLRTENEELLSVGNTFKERLDAVIIQNNTLKQVYEESRQEFQDEKRTLISTLSDREREIEKIIVKNKDLEKRLSNNIQSIRLRERDLENQIELMKLDEQNSSRNKDKYILDLKREIDRIKMDSETQRNRHNEQIQKLEENRLQNQRIVRGLRMVLDIARGESKDVQNFRETSEAEEE